MTIIESRYYGDVNRIANSMNDISKRLKELVALLEDSITPATNKKENEHGSDD